MIVSPSFFKPIAVCSTEIKTKQGSKTKALISSVFLFRLFNLVDLIISVIFSGVSNDGLGGLGQRCLDSLVSISWYHMFIQYIVYFYNLNLRVNLNSILLNRFELLRVLPLNLKKKKKKQKLLFCNHKVLYTTSKRNKTK